MTTEAPTTEHRVTELERRVWILEQILISKFGINVYGEGQHQIQSDPRRTDVGMGPLLNTNSEFL